MTAVPAGEVEPVRHQNLGVDKFLDDLSGAFTQQEFGLAPRSSSVRGCEAKLSSSASPSGASSISIALGGANPICTAVSVVMTGSDCLRE